MSVEEMITSLEQEKLAHIHSFDRAIHDLRSIQQLRPPASSGGEQAPTNEAPPIRPGSRFHPIPNTGVPASEIILRDRG